MSKSANKKKKPAVAKAASKTASKASKAVKPSKIAKPSKAPVKKAKPVKMVKPVKPAKPVKAVKVKPVKPVKVEVKKAKVELSPKNEIQIPKDKKLKGKEAKELKLKGKKGKIEETDEEEFGSSPKGRSEDDEDEDDDLFTEKKSGKIKLGAGERLTKDADLETKKMFNLADYFKWSEIQQQLENLEFFLPKDDACMQRHCENIRTSGAYCRLHYIANWKLMQQKKELFKEGKLQTLIEDFVTKYPANFINAILNDLDSDREFHRVLTELNISDTEFEIEETAVASEDEADDTIDFESRSIDTFKPGGFEEE